MKSSCDSAKRRNPHWSYASWANHLGLSGTAALTMVVNGDRHPGPKMTEKLASYFKFNERERQYFQDLIRLQKVKHDPRISILLIEKLKSASRGKSFHLLDFDRFNAIANWHYYVIREMTMLGEFYEDPHWIASRLQFKITPREARAALKTLIKLELIKRDEKGRLRSHSGTMETSNDISNEALKRFHEGMIDNAKSSIRDVDVLEREICGLTLAVKTSDLPRAKQMIRDFHDELLAQVECVDGNAERVYQLNTQFFPLTKPKLQKKEDAS